MKSPMLCCQNFEGAMTSPFTKIIVLGYYDGATSGLVRCGNCQKAYRFELVAWDRNQENRIYFLADIEPHVFDSIVKTLQSIEKPTWPYWMPRWQFKSSSEEKDTRDVLERDLQKASAPSLVIATDHIDKQILMCREVTVEARNHLPKLSSLPDLTSWPYWQRYLGLKSSNVI